MTPTCHLVVKEGVALHLSGAAAKSPQVTFRVPEDVKAAAQARALREGTTVSALAREAFERYIAS